MMDRDESMAEMYPAQMVGRQFCIEVSDSRLKVKPYPAEMIDTHATQRTFEVVEWSTMPRPASLNFQIFAVLHDREVSRGVMTELLLAGWCWHRETSFQAMNSRVRL